MVLDENRVFLRPEQSFNMADLVTRDRNHPSVLFYSFCNEPGCVNQDASAPAQPTLSFKKAVTTGDGTRAVTGNMCVNWGSCPKEEEFLNPHPNSTFQMPALLDVQGFSHVNATVFAAFHKAWPGRPMAATECCSCLNQRGEDADLTPAVDFHNPGNATVFFPSHVADCVREQTQWSNAFDYVAGSFVWTLHDYIGEPMHWPHVSSSFGSFDVAGFPKASAFWYRSWWLANISVSDPSRPNTHGIARTARPVLADARVPAADASAPSTLAARNALTHPPQSPQPPQLPAASVFVHIVERPSNAATTAGKARVVHVYSNAPFVRFAHGGAVVMQAVPRFGYATFNVSANETTAANAPSAANIRAATWSAEAVAVSVSGTQTVLATHTVWLSGAPHTLSLSLDAPTPRTGTGSALYLNGVDAALVRASVLDEWGGVVHRCNATIAFSISSGPGIVLATASGNPSDHVVMHSRSRAAYHGLARAVVRSNVDASGVHADRLLRKLVNTDAGRGLRSATIAGTTTSASTPPVIVKACMDGGPVARAPQARTMICADISIPTSTLMRDSPFEVAARSSALADVSP